MAQQIWKYDLVVGSNFIRMPVGADILSAGIQDNRVTIWAQVDPEAERYLRSVRVFGTGWELPPAANDNFVGTVVVQDGSAWHVYDMGWVAA